MPYFRFDKIQIGPITFYVWGIFLALAFLYGLFFVLKEAKKKKINTEIIANSFSWLIIGAVVGARLGYVFQFSEYYFSKPIEIIKIWEGGLTLYGGLFGMLICGLIYAKAAKISRQTFLEILDIIALVAPISFAIGRIGCSLINDHKGTETSLAWGIVWPDGVIRHPVAEYLIISALILYFILRFLKPKLKRPGQLFLAFLFLYSFSRFFLDFTRAESSGTFSTAQWLSFVVVLGIIVIIGFKRSFLINKMKNL